MQGFHKAAVHQNIQQAQQLIGDLTAGRAGNTAGQLLPGVTGIAPDALIRVQRPEVADKGQQLPLILRLKRFTAQQGDATLEQEISAVGKESPLPALVSLHDLQYFDSLQTFSYSTSPTANQAFTDFSGVEELSHLERFSMNGARPETLEPLSHLSQLKQLSLTECGTLDLTPLEGLEQLESLTLSSNDRIVSLEPVTKLPALRSLSLSSGTAVPSLEPLAQTNLAVLDLGLGVGQSGLYKEIDYSPLSQLPDLVCLNLTNHTRVTTKFCKQILAHSPDLRFLNIQNTPASEGSALDVEYLRAYTEADLLKRLANKLRNTLG